MKVKLCLLLLLVSVNVNAVILGFITGSDYKKMTEEAQTTWVIGVMDGIMAEAMLQANLPETWLGKCIKHHDKLQLKAIFEKELNDNPGSWHAPAAIIYQTTIKNFCEGK